jgi:hypothetical protein
VALNQDRSALVVAKDCARATAQRTIAASGLFWRIRKSEAHGPAMAGPLKRPWWLLLLHGVTSRWFQCCLTARIRLVGIAVAE